MKCANCGAEIKDGSIYCPVCGKEAQMVNGYVSLEDDFLHSLLRDDSNETKTVTKGSQLSAKEQKAIRRRKQLMPILITCCSLFLCIIIAMGVKLYIDKKNDNSYDYQVEMAQKEAFDHNYENALMYYKRALALVPNDIDARMEMAEIYLMREEDDTAKVLLTEVIQLDRGKKEAYQYLLQIYEKGGQHNQIKSLLAYAQDREIKELFSDYVVDIPTMFPASDTFYTSLVVSIICTEGHAIYYTTNGTDPILNGTRYIEDTGITLEKSGLYHVRAVCKNEHGVYGDVIGQSYQVILTPQQDELITRE